MISSATRQEHILMGSIFGEPYGQLPVVLGSRRIRFSGASNRGDNDERPRSGSAVLFCVGFRAV